MYQVSRAPLAESRLQRSSQKKHLALTRTAGEKGGFGGEQPPEMLEEFPENVLPGRKPVIDMEIVRESSYVLLYTEKDPGRCCLIPRFSE